LPAYVLAFVILGSPPAGGQAAQRRRIRRRPAFSAGPQAGIPITRSK